MKILLVYPDLIFQGAQWPGYYHHGIGYLSAVLKQAGHQVGLLHVKQPIGKEEFINKVFIQGGEWEIIGFSATTNMFSYVVLWNRWIKDYSPETFTICGGVHPTLNPEESLNQSELDAVCQGGGEEALLELCEVLETKDRFHVRNLWVRDGKMIIRNPLRPPCNDLGKLPFSDRDIFDYENLLLERKGRATVMASRGCPYDCSYCCNKALKSVYRQSGHSQYVRFRSVEHLISELRQIKKQHSFVRGFAFDDDILPLKKDWFTEFCRRYQFEIGLPFTCNLRPNLANEELICQLKDAGCWEIHMGIESGNERVRTLILNRQISKAQIVKAFSLCRKYGIKLYSYNMLGMPGEDSMAILETVKLNAELDVDTCQVTIFYPYSHTALYQYCYEQNLLEDRLVTDYFEDTILRFPPNHRTRIRLLANQFKFFVNLYRFAFSMPKPLSQFVVIMMDKMFLSDKCLKIIEMIVNRIYPWLMQKIYLPIRTNKMLLKFGRPLKWGIGYCTIGLKIIIRKCQKSA